MPVHFLHFSFPLPSTKRFRNVFSDAGTQEVVDDSSCALQAHEQDCFSIAVAAERWLASGGEDDVAYLWDHQVSGIEKEITVVPRNTCLRHPPPVC
ncbi:hypothetical protein Y032_0005g2661 [Ancylostoma ceylanicum]|uniref:WD domain, G-beta repeat protein n=1 Tax=Ancylostoma ceylanicum TaxID=53326 RepID=A0A016VT22_9BILA|nr:hypothetical protein Y032_0005g2661 [Ancylostoma ceylanicum]